MLFNSLQFIVFFPIVILIYFFMPRKARYLWLLLASYFFYMCWKPAYALLLLGSTAVTYLAGLLIDYFDQADRKRRLVVGGSLFVNFGLLFLFKYFNFLAETIVKVLGRFHLAVEQPQLDLLLPVGISFYIFQAVGYTIDIYRRQTAPEKNFLRYALFVSFFPQLVAGPIERSGNLLKQLRETDCIQVWNRERIEQGALVMLYGYFLKMVLADRMALVVDRVFDVAEYGNYAGFVSLAGILLFTMQIYCDFAGYTFIAIGAAKVMGFTLMNNFDSPYLAVSIKDFWDRWHISLSTWFRDYLYFPLGGSRKGTVRKYINIMIVFTLSGLWHGAAWHYVFWGVLHGCMRVAGEVSLKFRKRVWELLHVETQVFSFRLLRGTITFALVSLAWTFFRAKSIGQAVAILRNTLTKWNPWVLFDGSLHELMSAKDWNVLWFGLLVLILVDVFRYLKKDIAGAFSKQNLLFKLIVFYVGIVFIVVFGIYGGDYNASQFIYFQF